MKFTQINFSPRCMFVRIAAFVLTLSSFIPVAYADSFPTAYVEKMLEEARRNISVDIRNLAAGEMLSVQFADRPVYIYRRTASDIKSLENVKDPARYNEETFRESVRQAYGSSASAAWARLMISAQNISTSTPNRSLSPEILVVSAASPATGCVLRLISVKDRAIANSVFHDPCSKIMYDAAGIPISSIEINSRQFVDTAIAVPPYFYEKDKLVIGLAKGQRPPELPYSREALLGSGNATQKLIKAALYNDLVAVRTAIKNGANINHFKHGEGSPLDAAIIGSSIEIVELIIHEGAKPTINSEVLARFVGRDEVSTLLKSIK
jgi:hypothetical protein